MNMRKILIGLAVCLTLALLLSWSAGAALAVQTDETKPPPPMFHMQAPSGICADAQYLYVMADGKILQYGVADMRLVKKVDLPEPPPPPEAPPRESESEGLPPPPPPATPHGLWTTGNILYVLAGPEIHRYTTPDLTLQATTELPEPELPPEADN